MVGLAQLAVLGAVGVSGLVASACGAPLPARPAVHASARPSAPPASPPVWRLVRYPAAPTRADTVELAADGTLRLLVGGQRAEQRGKNVVFAVPTALEDLVLTCPAEHGFLHRARNGRFFWSTTFLGKLEPGGFIGEDAWGRLEQCGPVIVMRGKSRRLVARTGVTTLPPTDAPIVRFTTPLLGRAIAAPDRLLQTRDGGRTFQEATPRPSGALAQPEAWLGGTLDEPDDPNDKDIQSPIPVEAWLRRAVASETGRLMDGLVLIDGTWVRTTRDYHRTYVAFRSPAGRVTSYTVPGRCDFSPWGSRLLADCRENDPLPLLVLTADGPKPLPEAPVRPDTLVADPRGKLLAGFARDRYDAEQPHEWLLRFDGEHWQKTDGASGVPLALVSGQLLLRRDRDHTVLVPFGQPEAEGIALVGSPYMPETISLFADRLGYLMKNSYDQPSELVWLDLAPPLAPPRRYTLPLDTRDARFADAQHGVLIDNGKPSTTSDGGRTFVPVNMGSGRSSHASDVRCWSRGCVVDDKVAWTNEPLPSEPSELPPTTAELAADAQANPPDDPSAAPTIPEPEEYRSPMEAPKTTAPLYVCHATPRLTAKPDDLLQRLLQISKDQGDGKPKTLGRANTLFGLIRRQGAGIAWSGHDAAGDFTVEAPSVTGPLAPVLVDEKVRLLPLGLMMEAPALLPLLVTRGFALLQTMADLNQLFLVRADGHSTLLGAGKALIGSVLRSAAGNVAVLASRGERQELFWLDASGAELGRRWILARAAAPVLDAAEPGSAHLAVLDAQGAQLISLTPGTTGQPVNVQFQGPFAECSGPPAPHRLLTSVGGFQGPRIDVDGLLSQPLVYPTHWAAPSTAQGLLEFGERGACYRGVVMSDPIPVELQVAGMGRMKGTLIGPDGTLAVSCQRAPAKASANR